MVKLLRKSSANTFFSTGGNGEKTVSDPHEITKTAIRQPWGAIPSRRAACVQLRPHLLPFARDRGQQGQGYDAQLIL